MVENIYIIHSEHDDYIYAPLSRYLHKLSLKSESKIEIPPSVYTIPTNNNYLQRWGNIIVIPTQRCNLSCSYCYAQKAHSKKNVSYDKLQQAFDFLLSQTIKNKSVTFLGGGEPLIAWEKIQWSIEYLERAKSQEEQILYFLTTNATLLNLERLIFLQKHKVQIEVSFDILQEIQDRQRPFAGKSASTFSVIVEKLRLLEQLKIPYTIRSTITEDTVKFMPQMIQSLTKYDNIIKVKLEPVTQREPHKNNFYIEYLHYFKKAQEIGNANGIHITNSIITSVDNIVDRFCVGEFCLTPDGIITACHRNTSPYDDLYETCKLQNIKYADANLYQIEIEKFLKFTSLPQRCRECFARWHCAGFCPMEWLGLSNEAITQRCNFIREFIKQRLFEIYDIKKAESEKPE